MLCIIVHISNNEGRYTHIIDIDAVDGEGERVGQHERAAAVRPHQQRAHRRHLRRHAHRERAHALLYVRT